MKYSRWRVAALCAATMALACSSPSSAPENTETTKEALTPSGICGGWILPSTAMQMFCRDTQDVGSVYQEAVKQSGNLSGSVRVFAAWPWDEGQEGNPERIKKWFTQTRLVLTWLKTQTDTDMMDRSLKEIQIVLKYKLTGTQSSQLNQKKGDIAGIRQAITDKVGVLANDPQKAELIATLADVRAKIIDVTGIREHAKASMLELQPRYRQVVDEFKAYKATEPDVMARITAFAQNASSANLPALQQIKVAVTDYQRGLPVPQDAFLGHAAIMRAELLAVHKRYDDSMAPYAEFLDSRGLVSRDLVGTALRSVDNMIAYCETRRSATDEAIEKVVDGMRARTDALVELSAEQSTRDTLNNARYLDASKSFLDQSNARIARLWASPPESPTLKYPLFSDQYNEFTSFQQLESMCTQASLSTSSWMQSGCNALKPSFDRARAWMSDTLPNSLRMRLVLLRRKSANENLCKDVEAQLAAKNFRAAVASYDAAVRSIDPEVSP